jgi:hypothetical protein
MSMIKISPRLGVEWAGRDKTPERIVWATWL